MRARPARDRHLVPAILVLLGGLVLWMILWTGASAQSVRPPADAVTSGAPIGGAVPGGTSGATSDADIWRKVRHGVEGTVSIPDKQAGVLVQSEGETFRQFRNGPMARYGAWALAAIVAIIVLFFLLRGRIRIDAGPSGRFVTRFNSLERFAHWLTAGPFIVLALTGLNMLYGKQVLLPVLGPSMFATLTSLGKYAHNYLGFAFALGIVLMIVLWVKDNFPNLDDLRWIALGGGLLKKGVHPPARKFNAGQKLIFWLVVLLGLSLTASGICLLYPFELAPFAGTFAALNVLGFNLPTELTLLQETQLSLLWHGILALALIVAIIGHIYIGTLGMEGAVSAMTSGEVDENWAREHHSKWLAEVRPAENPAGAD